ncbi:ABC transporter substrate-binding protein [Cohnella silvisoli]|uniref:ABC transporter substrate-binding protein n=1 Tax=Cohnella silvisoli TaxID=2873699 RepID=A0ABV1KT14_9BACL|nr:ABC transporter substrate-binding protein [Cohnella silvisoli]MCD9022391.1 ABC transporter substrate-binding protein [Cohnella silvisoli]
MRTKRMMGILAAMVLAFTVTACGSGNDKATESSASASASQPASSSASESASPAKEKTTVSFWYLWGGPEGENVEKLIAEFNASQELYEVKGLSVPDVQKVVVGISSGDGPDITDNFSNNTASYAKKGMLEPLDEYIAKSNYDVSDFVPAALEGGKYQGKQYALPINVNFNLMFYNKKLFADAGIVDPPKTSDELLADAVKLTKVNANKTLEVLGFPDFPLIYYTTGMSMAFGGNFISDDDKTLTPDNPGTLEAIKLMQSYRNQFGVDNITKFNSSAKYLDATDPFIQGKQAIRIDGPWFGNTVKNVLKKDLDYGIAPLPGPAGHPELAGGGEVSSSTFFIPSNAKNKDGAWAFMSWLMSKENMTKFNVMFANLPARTSVYSDPSLQTIPDFQLFAEGAKSPNLKSFPVFDGQTEYGKIINDEFELAVNGKQSAEDAVKHMKDKSANLLK